MVHSLVHWLVRRPGRIFPHRQLFRVVLSTREPAPDSALRSTRRNDKCTRGHGDSATSLSPVCAAFLRFRQLQRYRRQDDRREVGHLRDHGADPQADGAGASVEDSRSTRLDEDH